MRRTRSFVAHALLGAKAGSHVSVDVLVAQLLASEADKSALRQRVATLREECGCAMGAGFVAAAVALTPPLLWWTGGISLTGFAVYAGVVFGAGLVGKATGVLLARGRLWLLGQHLSRRVRLERFGHVVVH